MTAEELFGNLAETYGDDFNWSLVPSTDKRLAAELNRELGGCFPKEIQALAKCDARDDVLFFIDYEDYRIYHLTYSTQNAEGFPRHMDFTSLQAAFDYIEQDYLQNYR